MRSITGSKSSRQDQSRVPKPWRPFCRLLSGAIRCPHVHCHGIATLLLMLVIKRSRNHISQGDCVLQNKVVALMLLTGCMSSAGIDMALLGYDAVLPLYFEWQSRQKGTEHHACTCLWTRVASTSYVASGMQFSLSQPVVSDKGTFSLPKCILTFTSESY